MKIGTLDINSCKIGSTQVNEVRIGSTLVWSYSSFDPDAQLFITNAAITDTTQQTAINQLVLDLKNYGIWAKEKAIYPFVGGTASQHKFNLKDPRDLDAAYRLVFNGGWTHSSNGALPNGLNAFADTKLNPLTHLTGYSQHVSNYSRTQNTSVNGVQIGCFDGASEISLYQYFNSVSLKGGSSYLYPTRAAKSNNTNTLGLAINNIIASNDRKLYFNGNILDANTNNETLTRPNKVLYLGASNFNTTISQFTPHEHAFDSIGDGLTDTEASNMYTAVQAFQTTLSRNV